MNSDEIIQTQRHLRHILLDAPVGGSMAMPGGADLTAHLLLYLDDSERCWALVLQWLRRLLDADRVDGGFSGPDHTTYQPQVESIRADLQIPSSVSTVIDAREASVRCVWESNAAVVFESVSDDDRFTPHLREQLLSLSTHAKLAMPLFSGNAPIGLICCDWTREGRHWSSDQCLALGVFSQRVLSPIFSTLLATRRAAEEALEHEAILLPTAIHLTQAELNVARLAVQGLSYKEIARQLDRSFSTVDHRLRTIRDKLGASSTARMIRMLSDMLARHYPE
jgi:DNA-binding CsgD family transcriptional regulator